MDKTMEEAWQEFADGAERRWPERDRRIFAAGYAAGAAYGEAREREKTDALIAVIRDEYGGHAVDAFVDDLQKRLKRKRGKTE